MSPTNTDDVSAERQGTEKWFKLLENQEKLTTGVDVC